MSAQVETWKEAADDIWLARFFKYLDAARLVTEIAGRAGQSSLSALAKQALPSLRSAAAAGADAYRRSVARRRFGSVREQLHDLVRPRFGRRTGSTFGGTASAELQAERRLLGLPDRGRLHGPDIQAAFKQAAKTAHPDRGGNTQTFTALVQARDALIARL